MNKRLLPLALVAALAALACTPTVAPPAVTPAVGASATPAASGAPVAAASAVASATPASPAASGSPAAAASPDHAAEFAEGCEHLKAGGTSKTVTANLVSMSRARASIADDHTRYEVNLVQNGGQSEGYVLFPADEAGEFHFFLDKDVPFKLMQGGKVVAFEQAEKPLAACPDTVKAVYVADLAVGQVELHFGPTDEKIVGIVVEHHGGAH